MASALRRVLVVLALLVAGCSSNDSSISSGTTSSSSASSSTTEGTGTTAADDVDGSTTEPTTTMPTTTTMATSSSSVQATGVEGVVSQGPTCPVERTDQPCPPDPMPGVVVDAADRTGGLVGTTTTDDVGYYELPLAPGEYTLRVQVDGRFPMCPTVGVRIPAGSVVTEHIDCDSGIR